MTESKYSKQDLMQIYKDFFIDNIPITEEKIKPKNIGLMFLYGRYNIFRAYDEIEGEIFFFTVGTLRDKNEITIDEIECEKLAYMLSDPWEGPIITYDSKEWQYCSSNEWDICLKAKTLEELFNIYNDIVYETAGKVLDTYPN